MVTLLRWWYSWYGNSLFDITEKYIVIASILKYMICLETTLRIHRVLAEYAMPKCRQFPRKCLNNKFSVDTHIRSLEVYKLYSLALF